MKEQDKKEKLLYEDEYCVVFRDIGNKAEAHYQCIPKRHIKNYTKLDLAEFIDKSGVNRQSDDL